MDASVNTTMSKRKYPLVTKPVAECGNRHHQRRKGEDVAVHEPLQLGHRRVELISNGGRANVITRLSKAAMNIGTDAATITSPSLDLGCCCMLAPPSLLDSCGI